MNHKVTYIGILDGGTVVIPPVADSVSATAGRAHIVDGNLPFGTETNVLLRRNNLSRIERRTDGHRAAAHHRIRHTGLQRGGNCNTIDMFALAQVRRRREGGIGAHDIVVGIPPPIGNRFTSLLNRGCSIECGRHTVTDRLRRNLRNSYLRMDHADRDLLLGRFRRTGNIVVRDGGDHLHTVSARIVIRHVRKFQLIGGGTGYGNPVLLPLVRGGPFNIAGGHPQGRSTAKAHRSIAYDVVQLHTRGAHRNRSFGIVRLTSVLTDSGNHIGIIALSRRFTLQLGLRAFRSRSLNINARGQTELGQMSCHRHIGRYLNGVDFTAETDRLGGIVAQRDLGVRIDDHRDVIGVFTTFDILHRHRIEGGVSGLNQQELVIGDRVNRRGGPFVEIIGAVAAVGRRKQLGRSSGTNRDGVHHPQIQHRGRLTHGHKDLRRTVVGILHIHRVFTSLIMTERISTVQHIGSIVILTIAQLEGIRSRAAKSFHGETAVVTAFTAHIVDLLTGDIQSLGLGNIDQLRHRTAIGILDGDHVITTTDLLKGGRLLVIARIKPVCVRGNTAAGRTVNDNRAVKSVETRDIGVVDFFGQGECLRNRHVDMDCIIRTALIRRSDHHHRIAGNRRAGSRLLGNLRMGRTVILHNNGIRKIRKQVSTRMVRFSSHRIGGRLLLDRGFSVPRHVVDELPVAIAVTTFHRITEDIDIVAVAL